MVFYFAIRLAPTRNAMTARKSYAVWPWDPITMPNTIDPTNRCASPAYTLGCKEVSFELDGSHSIHSIMPVLGMNLQICFMNETASDTESPSSDSESCPKLSKSQTFNNRAYSTQVPHPYRARPLSVNIGAKSPVAENGERIEMKPSLWYRE